MRGAILGGEMSWATFVGANLDGAEFSGTSLGGSSFVGANLRNWKGPDEWSSGYAAWGWLICLAVHAWANSLGVRSPCAEWGRFSL